MVLLDETVLDDEADAVCWLKVDETDPVVATPVVIPPLVLLIPVTVSSTELWTPEVRSMPVLVGRMEMPAPVLIGPIVLTVPLAPTIVLELVYRNVLVSVARTVLRTVELPAPLLMKVGRTSEAPGSALELTGVGRITTALPSAPELATVGRIRAVLLAPGLVKVASTRLVTPRTVVTAPGLVKVASTRLVPPRTVLLPPGVDETFAPGSAREFEGARGAGRGRVVCTGAGHAFTLSVTVTDTTRAVTPDANASSAARDWLRILM